MWATAWWAAQPWFGYADPRIERGKKLKQTQSLRSTRNNNSRFGWSGLRRSVERFERPEAIGTPIAFD